MKLSVVWSQHRGRNPAQQDALWNGRCVLQSVRVQPQHLEVNAPVWAAAVADGLANSPYPQRASRCILDLLSQALNNAALDTHLDAKLLRWVHGRLCDRLAHGPTFGASSTLVVAQIKQHQATILNAGDSRAYHHTAEGLWRQVSHDHTLINAMMARGEAQAGIEYAAMYHTLDSSLVADDDETDFAIHHARTTFGPGEGLLLCSDGVHDVLGEAGLFQAPAPPHSIQMPATAASLLRMQAWYQSILRAGAPDNFSMVYLQHQPTAAEPCR